MTTPEDREHSARLLHLFDAETLGDGNVDAGANVLAVMAVTIANLQRPDSAVVFRDGFETKLGCSLLVSGPLSASLTADRVLAPLQRNQDRQFANVRHWEEYEKRRREQLVRSGREADLEPENPPVPALADLSRHAMQDEPVPLVHSLKLLKNPPGAGFQEIHRHPLVFGMAGGPEAFPRLMESAHRGRPLVHVALNEAADCGAYAKAANHLVNGCQLFQPKSRSARGELIVTDSCNVLAEAVRGGNAGWLSRLLWLSDHSAGPAFEAKAERADHAKLDRMGVRFEWSLRLAWVRRIQTGEDEPEKLSCDFRALQSGWVRFLVGLEPSFPGITGALRSLPANLLHGLLQIRQGIKEVPKGAPDLHPGWVLSFARLLALRMVNARELILRDSQRARIESLAESVQRKLGDGPLTVRDLTRKSHRLSAADCEASLGVLLSKGLVTRTGNVWCLSQAATTQTPTQALTLDV
jgi:hypothetical protein